MARKMDIAEAYNREIDELAKMCSRKSNGYDGTVLKKPVKKQHAVVAAMAVCR
jgi:hypothetical protein